MKYCSKCGNELLDEAVICPKCGCQVDNIKKSENENKSTETNGLAIAGFVCSFFVPLLGLIFGIIGLNKSKTLNNNGKGLSIAAICISAVWMLFSFIYFIVFFSTVRF